MKVVLTLRRKILMNDRRRKRVMDVASGQVRSASKRMEISRQELIFAPVSIKSVQANERATS